MEKDLLDIARRTPYPLDAFVFVQRGLEFTVQRTHGQVDPQAEPASRHVSGAQLCEGLRDFALSQYGLLARTVLKQWHIHSTEDFGRIVFHMIDAQLMQKTAQDTLDDFKNVFDFNAAFAARLELTGRN